MKQGATQSTQEDDKFCTKIVRSLLKQGFKFQQGILVHPDIEDKNKLRTFQRETEKLNVARSRSGLERHEDRLLSYIASGADIIPERIRLRFILVQPGYEILMHDLVNEGFENG